jgi:hypothetical protein
LWCEGVKVKKEIVVFAVGLLERIREDENEERVN